MLVLTLSSDIRVQRNQSCQTVVQAVVMMSTSPYTQHLVLLSVKVASCTGEVLTSLTGMTFAHTAKRTPCAWAAPVSSAAKAAAPLRMALLLRAAAALSVFACSGAACPVSTCCGTEHRSRRLRRRCVRMPLTP